MKLIDLLRPQPRDGVRFHVWEHTKDRRTSAQKESYLSIVTERGASVWRTVFGDVPKMDSHVTAYQIHQAQKFLSANVLHFPEKRRAAK